MKDKKIGKHLEKRNYRDIKLLRYLQPRVLLC